LQLWRGQAACSLDIAAWVFERFARMNEQRASADLNLGLTEREYSPKHRAGACWHRWPGDLRNILGPDYERFC
jgi:hypothetical protein